MAQIAQRAGVTKALINYHFGGKHKLYLTIMTATFSEIVERVEHLATANRPAPDQLRDFVALVGEMATGRPHFPAMMLREVLAGRHPVATEIAPYLMRILGAVRRIVEHGVRDGTLRPVDPMFTHLSLVGSLLFFFATAAVPRAAGRRRRSPAAAAARRRLRSTRPGAHHSWPGGQRRAVDLAASERSRSMTPDETRDAVTTESSHQHPRPPDSPPRSDGGSAPRPASAPPPAPTHSRARRGRRIVVVLLLAALVALAAWYVLFGRPAPPREVVALSGRIEGDDSAVAAKTSGRLREVRVREGDPVEAGQVLAVLDDQQIRAREQQAEAAVAQAEAQVDLARRADRHPPRAAPPERAGRRAGQGRRGRARPGGGGQAGGRRGAAGAGRGDLRAGQVGSRGIHQAPPGRLGLGTGSQAGADQRGEPARHRERQPAPGRGGARRPHGGPGEPPEPRHPHVAGRRRPGTDPPAGGADRRRPGRRRPRPRLARRGSRQPGGPPGDRALQRHRRHPDRRAGRGRGRRHPHRHAGGSRPGLPPRLRPGGTDRPGEARPASARLPRLRAHHADRGGRLPDRPPGLLHAREHLLPGGPREAGRRREARAQGRRSASPSRACRRTARSSWREASGPPPGNGDRRRQDGRRGRAGDDKRTGERGPPRARPLEALRRRRGRSRHQLRGRARARSSA